MVDGDVGTTNKKDDGKAERVVVPKSIANMVSSPAFNDLVVDMYLEKASTRKATLVFCKDLKLVADLTQRFLAKDIKAAAITSKMSDDEREEALGGFKSGQYAVLVNCHLMAEGADIPMVSPTRCQ